MRIAKRVFHVWAVLGVAPLVIGPLLNPAVGREAGVGLFAKVLLLYRMLRNMRRILVLSHFFEHVTIAKQILEVPPSVDGCVVECGAYAGGSTANLSLVCALVGRELEVFDSFAGLPDPDARDDVVLLGGAREAPSYRAGQFGASLADVEANVARWGAREVCRFHEGFFEDTMPGFARPCVLAFLDVDLRGSAETCLRYLWPQLTPGARLYTHEAQELHMAALFFDREWWQRVLGVAAPGLAGAGSGLGLVPGPGGYVSELGYTIKPTTA